MQQAGGELLQNLDQKEEEEEEDEEEEEGSLTPAKRLKQQHSPFSGQLVAAATQWTPFCIRRSSFSARCAPLSSSSPPHAQRKAQMGKTVTTTRGDTSIPGRLSACPCPTIPCTSAKPRVSFNLSLLS